VRPCTANEAVCADYVRQGSYVIVYCVRVATRTPLTEGVLRTALWALYRKVPTLRVCLKKKEDGELWIKNVEKDAIDFEVLEDADVDAVYHDLQKWRFPEDLPLWGARLLPWAAHQQPFVAATSLPDLGEQDRGETARELPCVSHIMLVYHHSITDGFSCLRIMKTLLHIIDDVIEGRPVDEAAQVATIVDPRHENEKKAEIKLKVMADQNMVQARLKDADELFVEPLIYRKVSLPKDVEHMTIALPLIVHRDINKKFMEMCKKNKITYHTGFMAVTEAAYVKTLQDLGIFEDKYLISSQHCANLRPYFKGCENAFGNSMNLMDTLFETPSDVIENFWPYAQKVFAVFKKKYADCEPLMNEVIEGLTGKPAYQNLDLEKFKTVGMEKAYIYSTTNMLDVSKVFSNSGKNIRLMFYDRITSVQCVPCLWCSVFQTFHGHLVHSMQFNAHLIDATLAQRISDNIAFVMKKVSECK